ncbi:hypothetical protein HD806DRAFT_543136 [Xylariaceae sp. AK1471]|nr:hypothetical protein HD806DRAFT_543136 [Xylariaceae sp. AK1471]
MAELSLAILPLAIAAIKPIYKRWYDLCHYDREIKRLRKRFRAQKDIFLDKCQLLLQGVVDDEVKIYLGRKYSTYFETVEEVRDHILALGKSLIPSATLDGQSIDVRLAHSPYSTNFLLTKYRRIRGGFDLMLNKSKYESSLDGLAEGNKDLKRLRKTATKIRDSKAIEKSEARIIHLRSKTLPLSYRLVAKYSRSFCDALLSFWSCLQTQHKRHDVRVFMDSRQDGTFRVVVRYHAQASSNIQYELVDIWVRPQNIHISHISLPMVRPSPTDLSGEERPNKTRQVRIQEEISESVSRPPTRKYPSVTSPSSTSCSNKSEELDLCPGQDMCLRLYQHTKSVAAARDALFPVCDPAECLDQNKIKEPVSLKGVFNLPVETTLSIPQQLSLKLVKGILQFQSTPWLQACWQLEDFCPNNDLLMVDAEPTRDDFEDAQLTCGIRNPTMHNLSVALLQIRQWSALNPEDVVRVRRLGYMSSESQLGPCYQKLVQKCLGCDFGYGSDLQVLELQSAIYRDVVCELEQLIHMLEGKSVSGG